MNILLTSCDNPFQRKVGGKHIHQLLYERGLKESGYNVTTLYPYLPKRSKFAKAITLSTHLLPLNSYGVMMNTLEYDIRSSFSKQMKSINDEFDLIHAQDPVSFLYTKHIPCKRRVLTLHGYFTRESLNYSKVRENSVNGEKFISYGMDIEREAYALADFIYCVDSTIRDYLINEFCIAPEKIDVIFNAIDTQKFMPPDSDEVARLRKDAGINSEDFVVLTPRRLVDKNGVIYAVKAIKKSTDKNLKILIAGDGPEMNQIVQEAANDTRVVFLGSVNHDEVMKYFKMTDCVLIPSITSNGFQEATSLAMLEGMSMCKPTVCSAIGGMKEVIRHNETGFLVEEKNPADILAQIEWIRNNPERTHAITEAARKYILENHHYLSHTQKFIRHFSL